MMFYNIDILHAFPRLFFATIILVVERKFNGRGQKEILRRR